MKKPGIQQTRLIVLVAVGLVALLVVAFTNGFALKLLLTVLFLAAGSLQVWLLPKQAPNKSLTSILRFFGPTAFLLICFMSILLAVLQQFDTALVLLAFCSYLLPPAVAILWPMFRSVNDVPVQDWSYTEEIPHWKSTIFLNSIPVRFQVILHLQSEKKEISFKAPVRMKLGLIFFHMVQEQNQGKQDLVSLTGEGGIPFSWIFYLKGPFGWRRYLNPESSLSDNNIKPNMLIIAQQLTAQQLLVNTDNSSNHTNSY